MNALDPQGLNPLIYASDMPTTSQIHISTLAYDTLFFSMNKNYLH